MKKRTEIKEQNSSYILNEYEFNDSLDEKEEKIKSNQSERDSNFIKKSDNVSIDKEEMYYNPSLFDS